jgi:hypothetical protein
MPTEETSQPAAEQGSTVDLQQQLDKLQRQNESLTQSVTKLEAKRTEALDEAKRLKRINKLLAAAGIDPADEEAEASLIERLLPQQQAPVTQAEPGELKPTQAGPDPIVDAELKRLRKQLEAVQKKAEESEREKQEALAKSREDNIERQVVDALQQAGATQARHVFRLMTADAKYRVSLSEDGKAIGGPDYDPKPLSDVIAALRDDDDYSYLFLGSGMSGSGAGAKSLNGAGGAATANNPFSIDSLNATQAAQMYQSNPDRARRLMAEARSAGKLDQTLAKFMA